MLDLWSMRGVAIGTKVAVSDVTSELAAEVAEDMPAAFVAVTTTFKRDPTSADVTA